MIDDLLNSPSQKSYMTKLILAALTLLALIIAWMSRSGVQSDYRQSQQEVASLQSQLDEREVSIQSGQEEIQSLNLSIAELNESGTQSASALSAVSGERDSLAEQMAALQAELQSAQEGSTQQIGLLNSQLAEKEAALADTVR